MDCTVTLLCIVLVAVNHISFPHAQLAPERVTLVAVLIFNVLIGLC